MILFHFLILLSCLVSRLNALNSAFAIGKTCQTNIRLAIRLSGFTSQENKKLTMRSFAHTSLSSKEMLWHFGLNVTISFTTFSHQIRHFLELFDHFVGFHFLLNIKLEKNNTNHDYLDVSQTKSRSISVHSTPSNRFTTISND